MLTRLIIISLWISTITCVETQTTIIALCIEIVLWDLLQPLRLQIQSRKPLCNKRHNLISYNRWAYQVRTLCTYLLLTTRLNYLLPMVAEFGFMWFPDAVFAILFRRRYGSRNLYSLSLPPIDASNATPTPHIPLLASMATSPAQRVPRLKTKYNYNFIHKIHNYAHLGFVHYRSP